MDLKFRRLDEVASTSIASVPAGATVAEAVASSGEAQWVVVIDADRHPVGLARTADLRKADNVPQISSLVSGPLVMLPGSQTVAEAVRDKRFTAYTGMMTEILGIVVMADDGSQPLGVWSGPEFDQYLVAGVRGSVDTGLGGTVGIDTLTQRCHYTEAGTACSSTQEFAEEPDEMPDCSNPDHLTAHKFVW